LNLPILSKYWNWTFGLLSQYSDLAGSVV